MTQWDVDSAKTFLVRIYATSGYATVVRTLTFGPYTGSIADSLTQLYTSAQQTTDFGSPQSTLYYGIAEVGMVVGYESRSSG
jgi:hypothetical protein